MLQEFKISEDANWFRRPCRSIKIQWDFSLPYGLPERSLHYFPGNNSTIWWPDPDTGEMRPLKLSATALAAPGMSFDEWFDARALEKTKKNDKEHRRIESAIAQLERTKSRISLAKDETKKADLLNEGELPTLRDAKSMEAKVPTTAPPETVYTVPLENVAYPKTFDVYDSLMSKLFSMEDSPEKKT